MSTYTSEPRVADAHLFRAGAAHMLLAVPSGRIYEIEEPLAEAIDRAMDFGDSDRVSAFASARGIAHVPVVSDPPSSVPVHGISLAVAQKCNLGCTYCYAQQGTFGGPAKAMSLDVAQRSIDRLLEDVPPGATATLTFLGGEPLTARPVIRAATEYAEMQARAAGVRMTFALTTNATLLDRTDVQFFERHPFTVTISVDGVGATHDLLRPFKSGEGTYARVMERASLLLGKTPRSTRVAARVTVTPRNLRLRETLEELIALGFDSVLFSPVLSSPTGADTMRGGDFAALLEQLIECSNVFEERLRQGDVLPFLNVINTLRRIHRQEREEYPCGAGGGYLGVSAAGDFYACHRFVEEPSGAMGSIASGVDRDRQKRWLAERNVHVQEPCRTCWARYLCSGGCHHDAMRNGRTGCDYIRGWLHHCLGLYARLIQERAPRLGEILDGR